MRRCFVVKRNRTVAWLLAVFLFATLVVPLAAQSAGRSGLAYDVTRETKLTGTIAAVLPRPTHGMIFGSHLLLTTLSGKVDVSLGRWAMRVKGATGFTVGQQVELTGVMKTLNGKEVFLARTISCSGHIHTIRNERGMPISPRARERATRNAQRGGSL